MPVGVPEPCEVTVAVKVTDCPKAEGFEVEVSEVVVVPVTPIPVKLTVCGLLEALSVILTAAVLAPAAVGVKVTEMMQTAAAWGNGCATVIGFRKVAAVSACNSN